MKFSWFIISVIGTLVGGCSGADPRVMISEITLEIVNQSSADIRNAEARFNESSCKWGTVVKNTSAIYISYPHPITAQAELHWDSEGVHHSEKIDLKRLYRFGASGELTFTVYDDHVGVDFRRKS